MIEHGKLTKIGWIGLLAVMTLLGCGKASHESVVVEAEPLSLSPLSVEAFASTVYTYGQSQGCVECHASRVNPLWMSPDPVLAYSFAKPFVDFNNPTASLFATYAGNNHCNNSACSNAGNSVVMQSLLSQWAQAEIQQGSTGGPVIGATSLPNPAFVTASLPIPNPLPLVTEAAPAVLRFSLSQLAPNVPALNGAILEVSIQAYNSLQNEYKLFNPRIVGNTAPVTISGVHVYIRSDTETGIGTEDVNQGIQWSIVNATLAPSVLPGSLPKGPMTNFIPLALTNLAIQANSGADIITIGFAAIQ